MKGQPELIPGIFNFCDSWCERCLFTQRCRSYQTVQANGQRSPADPNATIIAQLTEALALTKQYIATLQQPPPSAPASQAALEEAALRRPRPDEHPVAVLAATYLRLTGNWLSAEATLLEDAGHRQLRAVELGVRTQAEALVLLNALKDAWEMIRWYRTLIPVKTTSALRAFTDDLGSADAALLDYHTGKAKLVLVSIDRSLLAWQTIMACFPEKTDDLLDMLALLNRLTRDLEVLFPTARAFRRPGLD